MYFVPVKELPPKPKHTWTVEDRCKKKDLLRFIEDFIDSGEALAEIIFNNDEYADAKICGLSIYHATTLHKKRNITIIHRNGKVFFLNKDFFSDEELKALRIRR